MKKSVEGKGKGSRVTIGEGSVVVSAEELKQRLEADRQQRMQACQMAIEAALKQHRCQLVAAAMITEDGRIVAQAMLRAVE